MKVTARLSAKINGFYYSYTSISQDIPHNRYNSFIFQLMLEQLSTIDHWLDGADLLPLTSR